MKKIIFAILGMIFLAGMVFFRAGYFSPKEAIVKIGKAEFLVEVAADSKSREKGLSGREALVGGRGMLFRFEEAGQKIFWMKGMKFDLDLIWIQKGKISGIEKNVSWNSKDLYGENYLADLVLEVESGTCDRYGIKRGDEVQVNY